MQKMQLLTCSGSGRLAALPRGGNNLVWMEPTPFPSLPLSPVPGDCWCCCHLDRNIVGGFGLLAHLAGQTNLGDLQDVQTPFRRLSGSSRSLGVPLSDMAFVLQERGNVLRRLIHQLPGRKAADFLVDRK